MKRCRRCGETKPLDAFRRYQASKDGRSGECRACARERDRARRLADPEGRREMHRRYRRERKEHRLEYQREYRQRNPDKERAHWIANQAIARGELVRPGGCEGCSTAGKALHAHHDDYAKPKEVRWLCADCHAKHHARLVEEEAA